MGLTLLDYLFDRNTQANSNLSGMGKHGKMQLDPLMVYGIRCEWGGGGGGRGRAGVVREGWEGAISNLSRMGKHGKMQLDPLMVYGIRCEWGGGGGGRGRAGVGGGVVREGWEGAISNLSGMGKHGKMQLDPLMVYGIRCEWGGGGGGRGRAGVGGGVVREGWEGAISNLSGMGKHGKMQLDPLMVYGIRCEWGGGGGGRGRAGVGGGVVGEGWEGAISNLSGMGKHGKMQLDPLMVYGIRCEWSELHTRVCCLTLTCRGNTMNLSTCN